MAFDPVPLAIGEGAEHTDDVWRAFANAATRDSQGVVLPGDMKVTALGSPGEAVIIAPGSAVIRNAQKAGQSYVGHAPTATQVAVPRNNTGSVVRHLLIARVIDPQFSPWQPSGTPGAPNVDVETGPYFEPFLISGVASNVTRASQVVSYSAVALARLDVASVGSGASPVTNAMIVPTRELAQPRTGFAYDIQTPASNQNLALTTGGFIDWPTNSLQVYVPRWATHAQVKIHLNGILGFVGGSDSLHRVNFAGSVGPNAVWDYNGYTGQAAGDAEMIPLSMYGEFNVQAVQDSTVTVKPQASRNNVGSHLGVESIWTRHQIEFDIKFSERVV